MASRVKTVVLTGATGGLGRALKAVIEAEGHRIISVQRQPGPEASTIVTDLADAANASADVKRGLYRLSPGGVDVLINNAGLGHLEPVATTGTEDARRISKVNFVTPAALTRSVWSLLVLNGGTILNIRSIASRITIPTAGVYAASKRALFALTEATP